MSVRKVIPCGHGSSYCQYLGPLREVQRPRPPSRVVGSANPGHLHPPTTFRDVLTFRTTTQYREFLHHSVLNVKRRRERQSSLLKGFPSATIQVVSVPFVPTRVDTDVHLFGCISISLEDLENGSSPDRDTTHSCSLTATTACYSTLPKDFPPPTPHVVHIPTTEYLHCASVTVSLFIGAFCSLFDAPLPLYTPQVTLVVVIR